MNVLVHVEEFNSGCKRGGEVEFGTGGADTAYAVAVVEVEAGLVDRAGLDI